jgi:hypothetical protein
MPLGSWAGASAPARARLGTGGVNGQKVRHGWIKPGDLVVVARICAIGATMRHRGPISADEGCLIGIAARLRSRWRERSMGEREAVLT